MRAFIIASSNAARFIALSGQRNHVGNAPVFNLLAVSVCPSIFTYNTLKPVADESRFADAATIYTLTIDVAMIALVIASSNPARFITLPFQVHPVLSFTQIVYAVAPDIIALISASFSAHICQ